MLKSISRVLGLISLVALLGMINLCPAQSAQGNIGGKVVDTNGAVVAGANVEATNASTGEKRSATTTDNGSYALSNLAVGLYTVTANANTFAPTTVQDVKVSVAFTTDLDITLNPAGTSASVVVTSGDAATQLNTTDQQLSTIIENKKILDLPLLARNPEALILLSPGVTSSTSSLGGFVVNGQRPRNVNFLVDGVDDNDAQVPGGPGGTSAPNIDAIEEFRVITSNFNAEFGRNTGAVVINSTKGGTNEFHGGAYIYYRSSKYSARNFFDITGESDPLDRKQFGTSIGGPIIKDRAFFFFNYEGDRFKRSSQEVRIVPSANARRGILNGTAFGTLDLRPGSANNRFNLPLDPAIQRILALYPLGNSHADDLLPGVLEGYRFVQPILDTSDQYTTRGDVRITNMHSLSVSYRAAKGDFYAGIPSTFANTGDELRTPQFNQGLSMVLTSTFSPNITNELRFGGNRQNNIFNGAGDGAASPDLYNTILSAFSSQGYAQPRPFGGTNGRLIGLINLGGVTNLAPFDTQFRAAGTTVLGDAATWVHGNHTFKAGGELRWVYANGADNFGRAANLDFRFPAFFNTSLVRNNSGSLISVSDASGGLAGTLNNFASFLYGAVAYQTQSQFFDKNGARIDQDYKGFRTREGDVFFQDTWRLRPNLTLNYGLRWEYQGVPYEVNGQLSTLVDQDPSLRTPPGGFRFQLVGKNSGGSNDLYLPDLNNFAPRFGFNYSPNWEKGWIAKLTGGPGKSVIRGGYGIFYDRVFGNLTGNAKGNPPFQQTYLNFVGDTLGSTEPYPTQTPSALVPADAGLFPIIFARPGNNPYQGKFAIPNLQSWNFGLQRELSNNILIEADYVGNKGTNQIRVFDSQLSSIPRVNAITGSHCAISSSASTNLNSGCAALNTEFFQGATLASIGFSTYHSLQLRVTKNLTNRRFGLGQIQGAYSWSHSIDDSIDALTGEQSEATRTNPRDSSGFTGGFKAERGNSGFDIRHRFVLNYIYELPLRSENKLVQYLIGDWAMSGIWQVQSGQPFSIYSSRDSGGTGFSQRASFNPNPGTAPTITNPRVQTGPTANLFINPPLPPVGATAGIAGNVARDSFVGPGYNKFDLSMIKRIPLGTERYKFTIRADFFNLFNRVNFQQPVNIITDPRFGQSTAANSARIIQFAARFDF